MHCYTWTLVDSFITTNLVEKSIVIFKEKMIYQKVCWKKLVFNLFQAITKKIYSFWNMELWKLSQMVNIALFYRLWVDNLADNLAFGLQHLWVSQDSSSSLQRTQHFSKLLLFISSSSSVSWFRHAYMLMFEKNAPFFCPWKLLILSLKIASTGCST